MQFLITNNLFHHRTTFELQGGATDPIDVDYLMTIVDTPLHGIAAVFATADECHHLHFRSLSPSTCVAMHNVMKLTKVPFQKLGSDHPSDLHRGKITPKRHKLPYLPNHNPKLGLSTLKPEEINIPNLMQK